MVGSVSYESRKFHSLLFCKILESCSSIIGEHYDFLVFRLFLGSFLLFPMIPLLSVNTHLGVLRCGVFLYLIPIFR